MESLRAICELLAPPLCAGCGALASADLCAGCAERLDAATPLLGRGAAGLDACWSSAPHDGVARELVAALKFRRLGPVAGIAAARIARLAPRPVLSGVLVPVPGARLRTMARGIDPPAEIARALSARTGMAVVPCLRRRGGRRQLGRRRTERLARPPKVELRSPAPASALLVDDVLTTGATLSACARALRGGGGLRVAAVTFARRL